MENNQIMELQNLLEWKTITPKFLRRFFRKSKSLLFHNYHLNPDLCQ